MDATCAADVARAERLADEFDEDARLSDETHWPGMDDSTKHLYQVRARDARYAANRIRAAFGLPTR